MHCFPWNLPVHRKVTIPSYCNSSLNSIICLQRVCSPRMCICWIKPTSTVTRLAAVCPRGKWKAVHTEVLRLAATGIVPAAKQKRWKFSVPPRLKVEEALCIYSMGYSLRRAFNSCLDPRKLFVTNGVESCPVQDSVASVCLYWGESICNVCHPAGECFLCPAVWKGHTALWPKLRKSFAEGANLF